MESKKPGLHPRLPWKSANRWNRRGPLQINGRRLNLLPHTVKPVPQLAAKSRWIEELNIMASTGLFGPFELSSPHIDRTVSKSIGAYALGRVQGNGTFIVEYVGRSDTDLNSRLKSHEGSFPHFKYGHFKNSADAFMKECQLYHDFGPGNLRNSIHPDRPKGSALKCPRCSTLL